MQENVNKKSLADAIAEAYDLTKKDALGIVDLVFDEITSALTAGNKADIAGFGKFEIKARAERMGINPATKEQITIKASKAPGFKAAKALKEAVK